MLSKKLLQQVEAHSGQLTHEVTVRVKADRQVCAYWALPESELEDATTELFEHLGLWLTSRTDGAIEACYRKIGRRRFAQQIPLSQLLHAFSLVKSTLLDFVRKATTAEADNLCAEYELVLSIGEFFDKAIYGAATGYEDAAAAHEAFPEELATEGYDTTVSQPQTSDSSGSEWDPTSRAGDVGEVSG